MMEPNDTFAILCDLRERTVRIETKLDSHAERRLEDRKDHEALVARVDALDTRTGKLESLQKIGAAIGAIVIFVLMFFQERLTALFA